MFVQAVSEHLPRLECSIRQLKSIHIREVLLQQHLRTCSVSVCQPISRFNQLTFCHHCLEQFLPAANFHYPHHFPPPIISPPLRIIIALCFIVVSLSGGDWCLCHLWSCLATSSLAFGAGCLSLSSKDSADSGHLLRTLAGLYSPNGT